MCVAHGGTRLRVLFISTAVTEGNYSRTVAYSSTEVTKEEGVVLPEGREKEKLGELQPH
jgi:threonine dehydratase